MLVVLSRSVADCWRQHPGATAMHLNAVGSGAVPPHILQQLPVHADQKADVLQPAAPANPAWSAAHDRAPPWAGGGGSASCPLSACEAVAQHGRVRPPAWPPSPQVVPVLPADARCHASERHMRDSHGLPELMPPAAAVPGSLAGFHSARAGPAAAPCLSAAEGAALQPRQGHADAACTGQAAAGRDGACCPGTLPQTWAAAGADLTAAYQSRCPVLGPLGCVRVPPCLDSCAAPMAWPD